MSASDFITIISSSAGSFVALLIGLTVFYCCCCRKNSGSPCSCFYNSQGERRQWCRCCCGSKKSKQGDVVQTPEYAEFTAIQPFEDVYLLKGRDANKVRAEHSMSPT
jgi:hypothetical protein